ncbi:hypothetical protein C7H85_12320 [Zobellella endophytica]|uniref:Uncharacterized protein n=1 Tax=Zobellella endophytica TaxID=2116700 RepID=A0A2P7R3I9_9GAMM|nr:biotin/lipoyl-binding protein [Zobellella endophytica]PSJ44755.1 hypothetical protein C7H85_12320 [Zobellella endophytica]
MNKAKIALLVMVAGLVLWLAWHFYLAYQPAPLRIQGQLEAQQYQVSSKIGGRIDSILVRKGDRLERGEPVFTLASPELEARLMQAEAGRDAARAQADEAERGARRQQVQAARDQWQQARAAEQLHHKTYLRIQSLYDEGVVPLQQRDEAHTRWQSARLAASAAYQQFEMTEEGAREEQIRTARSQLAWAEGAVAEVSAYTGETRVPSPHRGEVTKVLLQAGELAPQGFPVVMLTDMDDAWALFHVREDLLSRLPMGEEIEVYIPALDERFPFVVSHIGVMGDFATWRATDAGQGFDLRSFELEARPRAPIAGLRAGMSLVVEL